MKKKLGILIILFSIIITYIFWIFIKPTRTIPVISEYSQLLASFALVCLAWINFISTRHKILDTIFDGLDKSYIYHKYLGISMLVMLILHDQTISIGKSQEILSGSLISRDPYAMYGSFGLYLFVLIIAVALLAKKLNYERWKVIHKFMIIPYAFGIYHYYGSSNYPVFSMNPFSLWLNVVNFIGIASAIYSIFFYERTSFKYRYKISRLETVANGTLEITGSAINVDLDYNPGQFAFLKISGSETKFPSHPFTISGAPKKGELQFTIKALGDHTNILMENLKVGNEFLVSGPHGKFNYKTGIENQIWIAGGIGITPFRSFAEAGILENHSIDFFYAYTNDEEGAYVDELRSIVHGDNIRLHLFNAKEKGFLSVAEIAKHIKTKEPIDVYFCGPKPMRESLRKQFSSNSSALNVVNFHYEHFQFK
ncbi:ferredoxin reductase family protein [Clostridium akagii]|uniref:ferredoxin reductase family protein n=1 Tax=Clostridium akagii TaxID=91623 RepID=UPI00047ECD44|nr:ferric reductase-like transmembrane domain-containing protein [Clostridium akagii]